MAITAAAHGSTPPLAHRRGTLELVGSWLAADLHGLAAHQAIKLTMCIADSEAVFSSAVKRFWKYMELFAVSMDPKSITESLHGNLTMATVLFVVPKFIFYTPERTVESDDDPGDGIFGLLCLLLPLTRNYLCVLLSDMGRFKGLDMYYMENGAIVVIAYAFLLKINLQYYIVAPFPVSLVTFIIYLCNKIPVKQQHVSASVDKDIKKREDSLGTESMKIGEVERTVVIPFLMLLISAMYGDSSPVLSHFLLFSCCALGTLALLYSRLADEVKSAPALKPALEYIQMSYMVMLFITAHTVAAEWLGEVTALVCMPELIAGLVWFSILLHSDTSNRAVDKVTSDKDTISSDDSDATEVIETEQVSAGVFKDFILHGFMFIPFGAVLAGLITSAYAYDWELLAYWNTKATVACGIAGCLPYLSVWMISRWPGSIPSSDWATQLLKFLANICLSGACLLLFALLAEKTLAYQLLGLDVLIDPSVFKYLPRIYFNAAGVAWLVPFTMSSIFEGFIFDGSMFIPLGTLVASLISTNAYEGELLASWYTDAIVALGIAGCMSYLNVWVTPLLKFLANTCMTGACMMLFALLAEKTLAYRLFGLHDLIDSSVLKYLPDIYFSTAVALLVPLFVR